MKDGDYKGTAKHRCQNALAQETPLVLTGEGPAIPEPRELSSALVSSSRIWLLQSSPSATKDEGHDFPS